MRCCHCNIKIERESLSSPFQNTCLCSECQDDYMDEMDSDSPSVYFLKIQESIKRFKNGEKIDGVQSKSMAVERWKKSHPLEISTSELCKQYPTLVKVLYECPCDKESKHNHHFDYSRPFEVIRLCNICHRKEHGRLNSNRTATGNTETALSN